MPELILHLGFPKCASTTFQNQVFRGEKGSLGTYQGLSQADNYAKQFKACTPVGPRQWSDFRQVKKWVKNVRENHDDTIPRYLLSDEMLTNKNKLVQRPIIPFLKKFSDTIWTEGKVKAILVLRNYAERMASGYAQGASANPFASQAHFEQHIAKLLDKGQTPDYTPWVAELYGTLGEENVCILLMEEIGQLHFWEQLQVFCQLEYFQPAAMLNNNKKNTKRKGKDTWIIQPYNPYQKANGMANNIFGFVWPYYLAARKRNQSMQFAKNKLTAYYANKYSRANDNRAKEIQLKPDLREQIQAHYRSSTARLSELLGKDMSALGY